MDIVVWLRSLGLGKYEAAFRENEIDEAVLPSLTEENLKQLGVTALGHRVRNKSGVAAAWHLSFDRPPLGYRLRATGKRRKDRTAYVISRLSN